MSSGHDDHLGIVELHEVCGRLVRHHETLFRTLGGWVATTTIPSAQQLFAEAGHRHAWHAELWRRRRPTIPVDAGAVDTTDSLVEVDPSDRVAAYAAALDQVTATTSGVDARIDPSLDPATRRVVELTLADLVTLRRRTSALV